MGLSESRGFLCTVEGWGSAARCSHIDNVFGGRSCRARHLGDIDKSPSSSPPPVPSDTQASADVAFSWATGEALGKRVTGDKPAGCSRSPGRGAGADLIPRHPRKVLALQDLGGCFDFCYLGMTILTLPQFTL